MLLYFRYSKEWTIGIDGAKLFMYNTLNIILLLLFSPRYEIRHTVQNYNECDKLIIYKNECFYSCRFCTGRLYGTYSERRSTLAITVSRWTFTFLLLHNLTSVASYAATVCSKTLPDGQWQKATLAHRILEEVALLLMVLCMPVSYLVGVMGQRCCGAKSQAELESEKMDKIYQEVQ